MNLLDPASLTQCLQVVASIAPAGADAFIAPAVRSLTSEAAIA